MADKVIHVNVTATKSQKVNVSAGNVQNQITATPDSSQYYSNIAKNWAISDKLVNNEDYSAKRYANLAKQDAERANTFTNSCLETYNNVVDYSAEAIDNIVATKNSAISDISESGHKAVTDIESSKSAILGEIETTTEENKAEITTLADSRYQEIESLSDEIKENAQDIANRVSFAMFDPVIKDHVLTYKETKGLELQGTYVYKNAIAGSRYGYPDFYAKCLEEKSQATATSTTLGGTAITLYIHANGHTYYDIANKSIVDTFYNSNGIAWFYGIDTANERIFLPRNDYFFQLTGDTSKVNEYVSAGLPNITGIIGDLDLSENRNSGAFVKNATHHTNNGIAGNSGRSSGSVKFDASRSNSIYGNSSTVQPPASKKLLYICVGNTVSDTSWIDVVTQVEAGTKDINDAVVDGLARLNVVDALKTTQITNCITEIPQRIKLELWGAGLKLKTGSKVSVSTNGTFEDVDITNDITGAGSLHTGDGTRELFVCYSPSENALITIPVAYTYSSATTPTSLLVDKYAGWFDTSTNTVKYTNDGTTWNICSLPICKGRPITSVGWGGHIDQVFNGFGYIGSTVWVDKGIKYLAPNGRNADGTLKNVEFTTKALSMNTIGASRYICLNEEGLWRHVTADYDEINNTMVTNDGVKTSVCLGYAEYNNRITSFNPKLPFRAVDYSDKQEIISWGMPDYSNAQTKSTNTQYTATQAGYVYAYGFTQSSAVKIIINDVTYEIGGRSDSYGGGASCFIPVDKNDTYKTTGNVSTVKFIPMKGAN